jgi:hypothetical protein
MEVHIAPSLLGGRMEIMTGVEHTSLRNIQSNIGGHYIIRVTIMKRLIH